MTITLPVRRSRRSCSARSSRVRCVLTIGAITGRASAVSAISADRIPWVQSRRQQIDAEIRQREEGGDDHYGSLDHREVSEIDGADQNRTQPAEPEDVVDEDRAHDHVGELQAE